MRATSTMAGWCAPITGAPSMNIWPPPVKPALLAKNKPRNTNELVPRSLRPEPPTWFTKLKLGVISMTSVSCLMLMASMSFSENAVTATGTVIRFSSTLRAVTVISSSTRP